MKRLRPFEKKRTHAKRSLKLFVHFLRKFRDIILGGGGEGERFLESKFYF